MVLKLVEQLLKVNLRLLQDLSKNLQRNFFAVVMRPEPKRVVGAWGGWLKSEGVKHVTSKIINLLNLIICNVLIRT